MNESPKRRRVRAPATSTNDETPRIELVALTEIARWPRNPKRHDLDEIEASLRRFGFIDPIVFDEGTKRIVAGHGRAETLERMRDRGLPPPRRVRVRDDGEWCAPVLRGVAFENEREAEAYLVASNRLVELGGWDDAGLAAILEDQRAIDALEGTGFDASALDELLGDLSDDEDDDGDEKSERAKALEDLAGGRRGKKRTITAEDVEEREAAADAYYEKISAVRRARFGDVWKLGDHFLVCGDTGVPETLDRVLPGDAKVDAVITDPPYAIFGSSTGIGASIADDRMVVPFFEMIVKAAAMRARLFAHLLFFCDWRSWAALVEAHRRASLPIKNMVVWDKGGGLGSMYAQCHELVLFSVVDPPLTSIASRKVTGNRMVHAKNIVRENRATGDDRPHNASKPIALVRGFVERHTEPGELVLDMFIGGGTTLLACELTGRRCIGVDVEPKWIDVVIARWEKLTDRKAELHFRSSDAAASDDGA